MERVQRPPLPMTRETRRTLSFSDGQTSSERSLVQASSQLTGRWPSLPETEQPKDDTMLRHDQLDIRLVEIESTLQMIRRLVAGELSGPGKAQNLLQASRTYDWSTWRDKVELSDGSVCYAGHSFGGTAMVSACFKGHD